MISKFKDVPLDEDTEIILQRDVKIDHFDVHYQRWQWDGIEAESIIFLNDDVYGMTEEEIIEIVKETSMVKNSSSITSKRSDSGFTFINFNFLI